MNDITFFPIVTTIEDELGQETATEVFSRQVFCEKKSVPQSEFFQAGQSGIKAFVVLIVYTMDYQEETKVKYRDKEYSIYRTYERPDEKIELYCEVKAGG
ncbi:phage head-tail adapter protein [Domibacillus antri]|uniref:Phage head-tail adapter protein n=1 Tax=Domibacillus antri TaxID=1714264 RepID=A0A1Q8Q3H0_9BACI|nr:phage head closure protein [Domibacillus antri]OLN21903.1 phage head-tail adapter protein [Domibacillus antri]